MLWTRALLVGTLVTVLAFALVESKAVERRSADNGNLQNKRFYPGYYGDRNGFDGYRNRNNGRSRHRWGNWFPWGLPWWLQDYYYYRIVIIPINNNSTNNGTNDTSTESTPNNASGTPIQLPPIIVAPIDNSSSNDTGPAFISPSINVLPVDNSTSGPPSSGSNPDETSGGNNSSIPVVPTIDINS